MATQRSVCLPALPAPLQHPEQERAGGGGAPERAAAGHRWAAMGLARVLYCKQAGLLALHECTQRAQDIVSPRVCTTAASDVFVNGPCLMSAEEMERSQQRLAALEQEKVALLSRLQGQQPGPVQAGSGQAEGGEGAADGAAAERGTQGSSSSRVAEDSLRQELYAQVCWLLCAALCCAFVCCYLVVLQGWCGLAALLQGQVVWGRAAIHVPAPHARCPLACGSTTAVLTQLLALPVHVAARAGHAAAV